MIETLFGYIGQCFFAHEKLVVSIVLKTHIIYYTNSLIKGGQYMCVMITLSSVTSAKRVERALFDMGVECRTMHTPKIISQYGCSHSVKVKKCDLETALKLCEKMGVNVRGVFVEKNSGKGKSEYEKIK